MRSDEKAENQHYVPRHLLKHHSCVPNVERGKEQVWCFDKRTGNTFRTSVRNVLASKRFYEIRVGEEHLNLEGDLSQIEERAAVIIERMVRKRSLTGLTNDDRRSISEFLATQFVRTEAARDYVRTMSDQVLSALTPTGRFSSLAEDTHMLSDDEIKEMSIRSLQTASIDFGPHFADKHWHLIAGDRSDPFYLGDHPIVLENPVNSAPYGSMGLASPGICIYITLAPDLSLGLMDPAIIQSLRDARSRSVQQSRGVLKRLTKLNRVGNSEDVLPAIENIRTHRKEMDRCLLPLINGQMLPYDRQVVMHLNSLQVMYAHQWVVCCKDDFELAKRMISENSNYRSGVYG